MSHKLKPLRSLRSAVLAGVATLVFSAQANAFCGFYVAKADTDLFNESSKVALVRDGDRTVITMANDYIGDPTEFAMVIPVPEVITKDQVHISKASLLDHLDAYTAPRLVEYFDDNPCMRNRYDMMQSEMSVGGVASQTVQKAARDKALGVTIEESFSVGEYDILILSAKESGGLQTWLEENDYRVPEAATKVLNTYIKQGMKFFVAKVNLEEKAKQGGDMLRPISVAFESPKFMLPIRLGTVNAKGTQDLFVYALTRNGRVETTNYRTQKIPTGQNLPIYIKDDFGDFYTSMWDESTRREGGHGVFMEYAWDMNWCDPCAADPLSDDQLRELGVFWLPQNNKSGGQVIRPRGGGKSMAKNVFVTRLHVRYDGTSFPEDLKFQTTGDRSNFQGRYVLQHPYEGDMECDASEYVKSVKKRQEKEIKTLANMTGWSRFEIRSKWKDSKFDFPYNPVNQSPKNDDWWNKIWPDAE